MVGSLYYLKNECEKKELLKYMKLNGFYQLEKAENEIKLDKTLWFTDDLKIPNLVISLRINGMFKLYANENFQQIQFCLNSIDWSKGFLLNEFKNDNQDDLKSILKLRKKYNAIQKNLNERINSIYFGDIKDNKLIEILETSLQNYGFKTNSGNKMSEYYIKLENINEKIFKLNEIIDENNVVPLTLDDIDFVYKFKKYKAEFSYDELKWSIENGFSYGYKLNEIKIGKNGEEIIENVIASWCVIRSDGQTGNFHTLEQYKGKGYGNQVKAKLIISLLKKNITPICNVFDDNTSRNIKNLKLGFTKSVNVKYIDAIYNN